MPSLFVVNRHSGTELHYLDDWLVPLAKYLVFMGVKEKGVLKMS